MTTSLAQLAVQRFYDNSGAVAVGGKLYTYLAGTTTPQATYTDSTGGTPNTNPIVLNARGEAVIWLTPSESYKFVLQDAAGNTIWTVDNIVGNDPNASLASLASTSSAVLGAGLVGLGVGLSYAAGTVGGAVFTTVWGDGVTDKSADLLAANALGYPIRIKGTLVIGTPTTITVPILDTRSPIFTSGSQVTISNGLPVRPEWFGGNSIVKAIGALPSTGGVVLCSAADYNIVGAYALPTAPGNGVGNTKANVKIIGAGAPAYASDGSRFVSGSGTVIQGTLVNFADNFEMEGGLGIDCGSYVVDTLNGGNWLDGFVPGTHQLTGDGNTLSAYIKGVRIEGLVRVLMKAPVNGNAATYKHGCLWEHILGGWHGDLEIRSGYHGYANKSYATRGGHVWVYDQAVGTSYILKSDQYTLCKGLVLDGITMGKEDSSIVPPAGYIESTAGYLTENIVLGKLRGIKCGTLMAGIGAAQPKNNISIGQAMGDQITGCGLLFDANFSRVTVGTHTFTNTSDAGIWTLTGCAQVYIGSGSVTNSANDGYRLGGDVAHGKINAVNCTGWGVNRSTETVVDVNNISGSGNTSGLISSAYLVLQATDLVNGWVNNAGTDWPFQVELVGRTMHLRGVIKNGTASLVATLPAGLCPVLNIPFICGAVAVGGTRTFGHITVGSNGQITVDNFSSLGGTTATVFFNDTIFLL